MFVFVVYLVDLLMEESGILSPSFKEVGLNVTSTGNLIRKISTSKDDIIQLVLILGIRNLFTTKSPVPFFTN